MSPLKICVVGTGLIGPRHAKAVLQDPEAELSCIVDPNPAARSVAENLGTIWYASIQEMLDSKHKPEAAIVCTPNHTHVSVSKELLDGGIHVLVEKPISEDVASGLDLVWAPHPFCLLFAYVNSRTAWQIPDSKIGNQSNKNSS
jgi:predicted dehydrogenase